MSVSRVGMALSCAALLILPQWLSLVVSANEHWTFVVASIEGIVWGGSCGNPQRLSDVAIEFVSVDDPEMKWIVETSDSGTFRVKAIPDGQYSFTATARGHRPVKGSIVLARDGGGLEKIVFPMYRLWIKETDGCLSHPHQFTWEFKGSLEGFSASPMEHIINEAEEPFVVRTVEGYIRAHEGGMREPLEGALFEIRGPGSAMRIWRAKADERGHFRIRHVPPGEYRFKATLEGFQSVIGTVIVGKKAPKKKIEIELLLGV